MRKILFKDSSGKIIRVSPNTDYFPVLLLSAASFGTLALLPPLTWIAGLIILAFLRFLNRMEYNFANDKTYRIIKEHELELFPALLDIPLKCGLERPPTYFVDLKEARFFATVRYGKRPVIVLSSGLFAELGRRSPRALAVLAHEVSHISNGDELYLTLEMTFANWKYLLFLTYVLTLSSSPSFMEIVSTIVGYRFTRFGIKEIIKRREFFADARAANVLPNSDGYSALLKSGSLNDLPYHPSPLDRIKGLTLTSPVSGPSEITFSIAMIMLITQTAYSLVLTSIYAEVFPSEQLQIPYMLAFVFTPSLVILAVEIFKPRRNVTPVWNAV